MSNMNSALSVWQLVIMAVVPLAALCGWIITIFVVAREPRAHAASAASASASALPTVAGNGSGWAAPAPADEAAGATAGGQDQPVQPPGRRLAA